MTNHRVNLRNVAVVFAFLAATTMFFSCKKDVKVTSVTLDKTELTLIEKETAILTATVLPDNATDKAVTWSSSNSAVATVSEGTVSARTKGTTTITVTTIDGNQTASCVVTVIPPPHPAEPELVFVEGGTFTMGCTDGDCWSDGREEPAHQVTLSSFKIAKYEVTQKQWLALMDNNPSFDIGDNLPVQSISWDEAQEFIQKLNAVTEKKYRLPTEAEWEYAARGGNKGKDNNYKYSGSNNINAVAWWDGNSEDKIHRVGTRDANELGIYDMCGNVSEWCNDWYSADYYSKSPQNNPTGPEKEWNRVLRGGSFGSGGRLCRVAYRDYALYSSHGGFRLVLQE